MFRTIQPNEELLSSCEKLGNVVCDLSEPRNYKVVASDGEELSHWCNRGVAASLNEEFQEEHGYDCHVIKR